MKEVVAIQTIGALENKLQSYLKEHNLGEEIETAERHVGGVAMQTFYYSVLLFHIYGVALCFLAAAHLPLALIILGFLGLTAFFTFIHHLYYRKVFKPQHMKEEKK